MNFRKCPSTALLLVVNQILLIKMSAFTGDAIHIDQIYVHICMPTLYIKVLKGTLHFRNNLGSKDSLDPPKFVLKIRYSTPIMQKNQQTFLAKISKVTFRAVLAL